MYIDWVSGGTKTQCSLLSEVNQPTSTATPLKPLPKSQLSSSELAEWEIRLGHDYYLQSSSRKPKVDNHILIFCHRLLWFVSVWHIMTCFLIIYLYLNIFYITWTDPTNQTHQPIFGLTAPGFASPSSACRWKKKSKPWRCDGARNGCENGSPARSLDEHPTQLLVVVPVENSWLLSVVASYFQGL